MPTTPHTAATSGEIHSIREKRSVRRYAVAPGVMSSATTRTTPTAWSATTTVSASRPSSSAPSRRGESPIACACVGSNA
ncbi:Uncharacterised protein [Mycobacteroides abscessus]|nr:Uncharacterised protein [Mycobacteroides abscessus]